MKIIVVGGGIAGVCCTEELCRLGPEHHITLVSASSVLKGVVNVVKTASHIEEFEVVEKDLASLQYKNLDVIEDIATCLDTEGKNLILQTGASLPYDKLCICTGARPKALSSNKHILMLRDLDSVEALRLRLQNARRVLVAGNGGIALEVMQALRGVEIIWALKHSHIGDAFFDVDAAHFLLDELQTGFWQHHEEDSNKEMSTPSVSNTTPRQTATEHAADTNTEAISRESSSTMHPPGHAVGPAWMKNLSSAGSPPPVKLESNCVVNHIQDVDNPNGQGSVRVELTNGAKYTVDFVICAVGVDPATDWLPGDIQKAADGGVIVDSSMESSVSGVYVAGDACSFTSDSPHWFQMRLWTQARVMGTYAAHCMLGLADEYATGFNFELFTHVTRFAGKKVTLLGLYNGQGLEEEPREELVAYTRSTSGIDSSFVRAVLLRGRMQGAVLIGDTEMEEAYENIILDGLDVSSFGDAIVDPDAGIDHIFD